jgi:MFS family permease
MSHNGDMQAYLALIRHRPQFRYLWLAQVISLTGDWFNTIASILLINRYTDSGLAVSGLFLARALPPFLAGPFAGVVADRFNRRTILIVTDLLRAGIVLCFLLITSPDRVWLLYGLSILQFTVSAFFEPARAAIVPNLVAKEELLAANTLSSATWSAMLTLGAVIGGLTAAAFGTQTALVIDASSFLVSALLIWRFVAPQPVAPRSAPTSGLADFLAGLGYVRRHPDVGLLTLVKAMGQIGSVDVLSAVYAERIFRVGQEGATTLGLMLSAFGVGAVLGPMVANAFHNRSAVMLHRFITLGYAAIALAWLMIGWSPSLALVLAGCLLRGVGGSVNWTYSDVLLQTKVPSSFLGRVYSLDFGLFTLAMSASVWFSGLALDRLTLDPRFFAVSLSVISLLPFAVWGLALRAQRPIAESVEASTD